MVVSRAALTEKLMSRMRLAIKTRAYFFKNFWNWFCMNLFAKLTDYIIISHFDKNCKIFYPFERFF